MIKQQKRNGGRIKPNIKGVHPFINFIADNKTMSYLELSKKSGVHHSTIRRWRHDGRRPLLIDVEAVINTMGYDLVPVKREPKTND